jgi:hypothetical protein
MLGRKATGRTENNRVSRLGVARAAWLLRAGYIVGYTKWYSFKNVRYFNGIEGNLIPPLGTISFQ